MITVFGSINMDIVFSVEMLPGPGETLLCPRYKLIPGGKGANQAVAASRTMPSDHCVSFFGCLGQDAFGDTLLQTLQKERIFTKGIQRVSAPTGCASIWVDKQGENSIVAASGANLYVQECHLPDEDLSKAGLLILQLETPLLENCTLIKRAFQKKIPVLLNAAPSFPVPLEILKCVSFLVLNETEALETAKDFQISHTSFKDLSAKLSFLIQGTCIITLGADGLVAATPKNLYTLDAFKVTPIDTTGAGDTFTGALGAQFFQKRPLLESLRFASLASSLACLKEGAQSSIPTFQEVEEKLSLMPWPQEECNLIKSL